MRLPKPARCGKQRPQLERPRKCWQPPGQGLVRPARIPASTLLISPEFEGIKTYLLGLTQQPSAPLLISPEFEGIKTLPRGLLAFLRALLISPEFEGIKTFLGRQQRLALPLLISPEFEGIKTGQVS